MRELIPETVVAYLRETGRIPGSHAASASALGWGVSNVVIRVDLEDSPPIILKQARERLRTRALWVSRLERIWTERAALELLAGVLPNGVVPRVLFADPDNYLFAMSCAPDDSVVWKEQLLAGQTDNDLARLAGTTLGTIHAETIDHPAIREGVLSETVVFDELRIEPFYRSIARAHPDLADEVAALIDSMAKVERRCFVHADFSPKNILVHGHGLTLVDFETAHGGDAAFDLGFVLSHLLLKAVRAVPNEAPYLALAAAFREGYDRRAGNLGDVNLIRRAVAHTAGCALARVDGTSPVDYLDGLRQEAVRRFARGVLQARIATWDELLGILAQEMQSSLEARLSDQP
jgi:5-methylthioribose kinase